MPARTDIVHDLSAKRFVLPVEGREAVLEYRLSAGGHRGVGATTIDFIQTYVPAEFRGRGLAERLVRHGLQWAKAQGYDIQASCWYVRKFIRP